MLGVVSQQCCVRFHGRAFDLSIWLSFSSLYCQTLKLIVSFQHKIGESWQMYCTSHSYWSQQCCVLIASVFCCRGVQTDATTPPNRNFNMQQGVKKDATCTIQQCCVRLCTGRPNIVSCYMLRPFAHPQGTSCCKMLHVVASCCWELLRSLKQVKRLATCKRTQQLSTLLGVAVSVYTQLQPNNNWFSLNFI